MVADPDDVSDPLGEQFGAFAALNDNDLEALADGFPDERFTDAVLAFLERGGIGVRPSFDTFSHYRLS